MRLALALPAVLLATLGCHHAAKPAATAGPTATPAAAALPCGVATIEELDPFGHDKVGTCTVIVDGDNVDLREGDRLIVESGEAKPLVAFDPRIVDKAGLHAGLTGAQVQAQVPDHHFIDCTVFPDMMQCELRRTEARAECGEGEPGIYLDFEIPDGVEPGATFSGDDAWRTIHDAAIAGLVLAMPC